MRADLSRAHFDWRAVPGEVGVSARRSGAGPAAGGRISDGTRLVTADLAPAAEDLLAAAQSILQREGYGALTYRRIAAEAGRNQALISYYFGDRAGLITLLVDWLNRDRLLDMERTLRAAPPDPAAVTEALLDAHLDLARDIVGSRLWLELAPNVATDSRIRPRVALVYASYRQLAGRAHPDMAPLTDMLVAMVDGMAVQYVLGGPGFDGEGAYGLLRRLSRDWLREKSSVHERPRCHSKTSLGDSADPGAPGDGRQTQGGTPPADPRDTLSSSARKVLQSAYKVVKAGGLESLTMGSAAGTSGQSATNVTYHFGSKAELQAALARLAAYNQWSTWSDWADQAEDAHGDDLPVALEEPRLRRSLGHMRAFYNLIPVSVRDEAMGEDYGNTFAAIRALLADHLADAASGDRVCATHLATLTMAVTYGLALQLLLERDGEFPGTSIRTWGEILQAALDGSTALRGGAPAR
jgi:AcrR family transcriptional regulator